MNYTNIRKKKNQASKIIKRGITFIPIIWTQSTAVPVALERNSARVSSAMARRLKQTNNPQSLCYYYLLMKIFIFWIYKC